MGKLYASIAISFIILLIINITFVIINVVFWATNGLQALLHGMNFVESVYYSTYLKWIILTDILWIIATIIFIFKRKHYKTNTMLHYLSSVSITHPKICVIIPTYNEELVVERVIKDYLNQKNVQNVIVVDNCSKDKTVEIAEKWGVTVIKKNTNLGYAHSCVMGLKESLKTDANIIVLTEADNTFSGNDLAKMIPYLDNCDMVIGTRQIQVLSEKGNQNKMFYVWGNFFLAKLVQIKYFSLLHMGIVALTDVGCSYRCIKRNALEKIIDKFTYPGTDQVIVSAKSGLFALFMTILAIENDLKIVEVPITFRKRIGVSKTQSDNKLKAIGYGLEFLWYILRS